MRILCNDAGPLRCTVQFIVVVDDDDGHPVMVAGPFVTRKRARRAIDVLRMRKAA